MTTKTRPTTVGRALRFTFDDGPMAGRHPAIGSTRARRSNSDRAVALRRRASVPPSPRLRVSSAVNDARFRGHDVGCIGTFARQRRVVRTGFLLELLTPS